MTIYVDDMYKYPMGQFGRMKMSHMMSDQGEDELLEFAQRLGLHLTWIQKRGQGRDRVHFDVGMGMRKKAIEMGAVPVTMDELGRLCRQWRGDK